MMNRINFWVSSENPCANSDQRDLENIALRLLSLPEMQRARAAAKVLWSNVMAHPACEQMSRFDNMIDEYLFYHALRGANSDSCHPKILRLMTPPAHWFGRNIPGSRWGGDSPDFIYRMVPITHGASYKIHGKSLQQAPTSVTYSLMGGIAAPTSLGMLESPDMEMMEDGSFTLSIDGNTSPGNSNHLQTQAGVNHLLIRDVLNDWSTETPNSLQVEISEKPVSAPLTENELARNAAKDAMDMLYYTFYCTQSANGHPPNEARAPMSSGAFGGMPSQWGTKCNICLEADEALIVRVNAAGAQFRNATISDIFYMSNEFWSRTSSLNTAQMASDDDGQITFVIAHEDPDIHNWLDTGGLRRTIFGHRWQMIAKDYSGEAPTISMRLVKFADLDLSLSSGVKRIDKSGREKQLQKRASGFARRFFDS